MTSPTDIARWRSAVTRYSRLRWLGIVLFGVALLVAGAHLWLVVTAGMSPWKLLPCLLGLGLSLGSFGAADDTVLFAMGQLQRAGQLTDPAELALETSRRPERVGRVHDSPKAALILPMVVIGVLTLLSLRVVHWEAPVGDTVEALP